MLETLNQRREGKCITNTAMTITQAVALITECVARFLCLLAIIPLLSCWEKESDLRASLLKQPGCQISFMSLYWNDPARQRLSLLLRYHLRWAQQCTTVPKLQQLGGRGGHEQQGCLPGILPSLLFNRQAFHKACTYDLAKRMFLCALQGPLWTWEEMCRSLKWESHVMWLQQITFFF